MEPSKQESVSRQSSILKPPKQRNPLQAVEPDPASSESSPTVKIKRRVSFARNKRIREFCNEAEQGTVWDETYEEHDLSSTKSSTNSSNGSEQPVVISVPCQDKENFPVQLFLPTDQLDYKEVPASTPCEDGDNLSQCDMEMDNSIMNAEPGSIEMENSELECPNATIYCNDGMDLTLLSTNIIPCRNEAADSSDNTVPVLQNPSGNVSMEIMENLPLVMNKNAVQDHEFDRNSAGNSTDLTQAISKILAVGRSNKVPNQVELGNASQNTDTYTNKMNYSNTAAMEFTSVLPSSTWIRPNSQCEINEKSENLAKAMEFTMPVPCADDIHNDGTDAQSKNTNIFVHKSMEITEAILTYNRIRESAVDTRKVLNDVTQEKTKNFSNKSMEMTEAVPIVKINQLGPSAATISNEVTRDKTEIFPNKSMEMTEAIPASNRIHQAPIVKINQLGPSTATVSNEVTRDKTEIFPNKSMEMTEAIPAFNRFHQATSNPAKVSHETTQERTNIFSNKSMEITEAVHIYNRIHDHFGSDKETMSKELMQEKTTIHSKSMDITEAVPVCSKENQPSTSSMNILQEEKTRFYSHVSMEITEAVPVDNKNRQSRMSVVTESRKETHRNTEICSNVSMAMTGAVRIPQSSSSTEKVSRSIMPNKTKMFADKSMEMTEVVGNYKKVSPSTKHTEEISIEPGQEKTKIFTNASMEITEAVPLNNKVYRSDTEARKVLHDLTREKSRLASNLSMEMTEPIVIRDRRQVTQDKTKIFPNRSMEMTEVISKNRHIYQSVANTEKSSHEKTGFLADMSMEMTEAVPVSRLTAQSGKTPNETTQNKTKIFPDKSMEITEAVPIRRSIHPPTISGDKVSLEKTQEKTSIFANDAMEMTEAVLMRKSIHPPIISRDKVSFEKTQEKTSIFANDAMEMTEAVPVYNKIYQSNLHANKIQRKSTQRKSTSFYSKPGQTTESDLARRNKRFLANAEKLETFAIINEIDQFLNDSLESPSTTMDKELTTTLKDPLDQYSKLPVVEKSIASGDNVPAREKTKIFSNLSMDISETIPVHRRTHQTADNNNTLNIAKSVPANQKVSESSELPEQTQGEERTVCFLNKSMDVTEAIPGRQIIFPDAGSKRITDESTPTFSQNYPPIPNVAAVDRTKYFSNKSMELTENLPIRHNQFSGPVAEKSSRKPTEDTTKFFLDTSMNITETIPIRQQIPMSPQMPNKIAQEKTNIYLDKSMDMTEMVATSKNSQANAQPKNTSSEGTQLFHDASMDCTSRLHTLPTVTKTTDVPQEARNKESIEPEKSISSPTKDYHDGNGSMEMTSRLPVLQTVTRDFITIHDNSRLEVDKPTTNDNQRSNSPTKLFCNTSMEFTGVPPVLLSTTNNFDKSNAYVNQSILSGRIIDMPNPNSINISKGNNYEITDRYNTREESFHRITSDELNTLCASMNLPTQKYAREESVTASKNYIPSCNDVNVLRDSLKNNTIFQQSGSAAKNKFLNRSLVIPTRISERFDKTGNSKVLFGEAEQSMIRDKEPTTMDFLETRRSTVDKSAGNFDDSRGRDMLYKSITATAVPMETEKITEHTYRYPGSSSDPMARDNPLDVDMSSRYLPATSTQPSDLLNYAPGAYETNYRAPPMIDDRQQSRGKMPTAGGHTNAVMDISTMEDYQMDDTVLVRENDTFDRNAKSPFSPSALDRNEEKLPSSNILTGRDALMEFSPSLPALSTVSSNKEITEPTGGKNITTSTAISVQTSVEISQSSNRDKISAVSRENSFSRIPSDSTELLIATMGMRTELSYPLIINDKTTITISNKSVANKTYTLGANAIVENQLEPNKTFVVDTNKKNPTESSCLIDNQRMNDVENEVQSLEIPVVGNDVEPNDVDDEGASDKENEAPGVRVDLFPDNYSEELDEIEPPSFLCDESMQGDSPQHVESFGYHRFESLTKDLSEEGLEEGVSMLLSDTEEDIVGTKNSENIGQFSELQRFSSGASNSMSQEIREKSMEVSPEEEIIEAVDEPVTHESKEEVIEPPPPLTPFQSLVESIQTFEKSDDCIWSVRKMDPKLIAIDFMSKSLVVILRLNEIETDCARDIEKIQIVSLLKADAKDVFLRIVHNLLLTKLIPDKMLKKYKMYEDVMRMLEYLSSEVILIMNFMFDLQRLDAMNLMDIDTKRVIFMVASRKANIILKVSLVIKIFNEIVPDDIDVTCILGDIRKNDIKQLIVNTRRDYKFLSRYINDVKDYITLMEESTCLNKH